MGKNMTLIRHPNISTCFDDDKLDATFQNTQSIQLQKFCLFMLTVIDIIRYDMLTSVADCSCEVGGRCMSVLSVYAAPCLLCRDCSSLFWQWGLLKAESCNG